jgi:hypothetical protein
VRHGWISSEFRFGGCFTLEILPECEILDATFLPGRDLGGG